MSDIKKLLEIMARLRNPDDGCPWDLEQSFETIAPYTVEEAYEVADAIVRKDADDLRDELGDLLFQVVFHARLGEEAGDFNFSDVVAAICEKMIRRHPHVFGDEAERKLGAQEGSWEQIKVEERAGKPGKVDVSVLQGVAVNLPALRRAEKLGKRAAGVGFDWPDTTGVRAKIEEEFAELDEACKQSSHDAITEEFGDLLFSLVNLARHLQVDAEQALAGANRKFEERFRGVEEAATKQGQKLDALDLDALESLWEAQKKAMAEKLP